jgi:hypothetical protein
MFHAGLVAPSCSLLLQLLTLTGGEVDPLPVVGVGLLVGLHLPLAESPVRLAARLGGAPLPYADEALLAFEIPRPRKSLLAVGVAGPPVDWGLSRPRALRAPIADGNAEGLTRLAARLKDPRHCKTCAGSFCSYRSTVRNMSWSWRFSGGDWQARRKWEMFSIWMNGMADFLNLMPGGGSARLANL